MNLSVSKQHSVPPAQVWSVRPNGGKVLLPRGSLRELGVPEDACGAISSVPVIPSVPSMRPLATKTCRPNTMFQQNVPQGLVTLSDSEIDDDVSDDDVFVGDSLVVKDVPDAPDVADVPDVSVPVITSVITSVEEAVVPVPVVPDAVVPVPVVPDAVVPDAVVPDAVVPDAVVPDAVVPDAVVPDAFPAVPVVAVAVEDGVSILDSVLSGGAVSDAVEAIVKSSLKGVCSSNTQESALSVLSAYGSDCAFGEECEYQGTCLSPLYESVDFS